MGKNCSICGHETKYVGDKLFHNFKWQPTGSGKWKDDLSIKCKCPVFVGANLKGPCNCVAATRVKIDKSPVVEVSRDGLVITTAKKIELSPDAISSKNALDTEYKTEVPQ